MRNHACPSAEDVYNGELGVGSHIDMDEGEFVADFDDRPIAYGFGELDELVLAYATTIHKSQGSEYPAVVTPLTRQHYLMLQRNLVYTGVTRGKCLWYSLGSGRQWRSPLRVRGHGGDGRSCGRG